MAQEGSADSIGTARVDIVVDTSQFDIAINRAKSRTSEMSTAAQQEYAKLDKAEKRRIDRLLDQANTINLTKEQQIAYQAALRGEGALLDSITQKLAQNTAAMNANGMSAKAQAAAMRGVPAQLTDIVTSLQGGQSPLTVLFQQGGQLRDMFGGIVLGGAAFGRKVGGLVNPFTVAAAAAATLGYAWYRGTEDAKAFNAAIALTGNYAGITADSLNEMALRLSAATHASFGDARDVLLSLARSGEYTSSEMESLSGVIVRASQISGESLENVGKIYAGLAKDPSKWAEEHNNSMHFMDTATYQHIKALQDAGEKHQAVQAVIDATTKQVANASTQNLGTAAKAWEKLRDTVSSVWEGIKRGLTSGPSLQDRIDTLLKERSDIQQNPYARNRVKQIDEQVAYLQEQERLEKRAATLQAENQRRNAEGIEAAKEWEKQREQIMSNAERRQKEIEDLNRRRQRILADGGTFSDADYQKAVANINDKYKDKATKPYRDDAGAKLLQQIRDQEAATQQALATTDKLTEAEKKRAEFLQQIDDLKGKKTLTDDQKSLLASQDQIKAEYDKLVALEKQSQLKEQMQKLDERAAAVNAQIGNFQASQQEQYARQLDAVGLGNEAQKRAEQVKSIYRTYEQMQFQLEKATPKNLRGTKEYDDAMRSIREGLSKSLDDYDNYYASLKEKQGHWLNGLSQAVADYSDMTANVMAQTERLTTNAFSGMEDALVSFVKTGKLDFKSLADSIITDLIRMQVRAQASGIFSMIGSAAMSFVGGGTATGTDASSGGYNNLFADGSIRAHAKGGIYTSPSLSAYSSSIVDKPTLFAFAKGAGLMGEAGPEAIMPLRRGRDGSLGVMVNGGSAPSNVQMDVSISVDASGTKAEGNTPVASELGRRLGDAVRAVIVQEKRPGGLLTT